MPMKKGCKALVAEAAAKIKTYSVAEAQARLQDPGVVFVDLRDPRELEREGIIPGAFHAPRGMLEFWVDPDSPYYKPVFGEDKEYIFFCAGGLRSALATAAVQDMGLTRVADLEGGFAAWRAAGAPVAARQEKQEKREKQVKQGEQGEQGEQEKMDRPAHSDHPEKPTAPR